MPVTRATRNQAARLVASCLLLACAASVWGAHQVEPRTLYSPIVNKPFKVVTIPRRRGNDKLGVGGAPNMGTDIDGCRHTTGMSEYDHFVVTDPYSYFSALAEEWGANGHFIKRLPGDVKSWLLSKDGFNDEWVTDKSRLYKREAKRARLQGQPFPPLEDWVIPQNSIPLEKRYRYALMCYRRRNFPSAFQAKLALSGAWALRARLNRPLMHSQLKAGILEVDNYVQKHIVDGEAFDLDKWLKVYRGIFNRSGLTDEAYFVAGLTLMGLELRKGDLSRCEAVITEMERHFADENDHLTIRGLLRARRRLILKEYVGFLDLAATHFVQAIRAEAFARPRLPEILFAVAECYRRAGQGQRAMNWYLALTQMEETQPQVRSRLREQGKFPSVEAPYAMLVAWRAQNQMTMLNEKVEHNGKIGGPDREVLFAVLNEGLGTPEYENPRWRPRTDGAPTQLQVFLDEVGKRILLYHQSRDEWPRTLQDLWMHGYIRDRNIYNRFHCPITGEPFLYHRPVGQQRGATVLLATSEPIETPEGPQYGMFLADMRLVWSSELTEPGMVYRPPGWVGDQQPETPADTTAAGD